MTYKKHVAAHLFIDESHDYNTAGGRFNAFSQEVAKGANPAERERIKAELLDEVRGNLSAFLGARDAEQPFAWYFSPINPHRPWAWQSAQSQWGLDPDDLKGKLPTFLPDNEVVRQDMADYLGEAMAFDAAVGVIVDELHQRGLLDNTILVVSGDHGAPGFPRGKANLFDFGTQVPLIIHWPNGVVRPGRRVDNPISLIDLAPTYLQAAGLPLDAAMDGHALVSILRDGNAEGLVDTHNEFVITGRERHFFSAREGWLPYPSRAIRTTSFLYIRNFKPDRWPMMTPPLSAGEATHGDFDGGPTKRWFADIQTQPAYAEYVAWAWERRPQEELYDLRADPDQVQNLAGRSDHADRQRELSSQLLEVLNGTGDPRVVGSGDAFDRAPYHLPDIDSRCHYRQGRLQCADQKP